MSVHRRGVKCYKLKRCAMKILYVEDDALTRLVMRSHIMTNYADVYEASNGAEGLRMFKEHSPDLVITDIAMPVMDGYEMIRQIKEYDKNARIIVTSAFACAESIPECTFVDKPISLERLIQLIKEAENGLVA